MTCICHSHIFERNTTAQEWIQKAAAQGDENAIVALQKIDEHLGRTTTTSTDDKKKTSSNTTTPQNVRRTNDKKETSSSTTQQQPEEQDDECPICLEVLPKLSTKFVRMVCCGKGMHYACGKKQDESKSLTVKHFCVLCRTKLPTKDGSKVEIDQLRFSGWREEKHGVCICWVIVTDKVLVYQKI